VEIRRATRDDAEAIAYVQERSWQAAYRHIFPVEELDRGGFIRTGRWRDRLARPPAGWTTLVAEGDREVIGFAAVGPSRDESGTGELYAIYVDPEHWSTGAGRALIERSELELRSEYVEATLWVLEHNPRARFFYERAGWAADGGRKSEERWGVNAPELRYRKRLTTSRSPS
jgi:GNAT superfamily N-acetyltransferase